MNRPSNGPRREALVAGLLSALPIMAALPAALFIHDPMARDQGVFGYIAWRWLAGDTPYLLAGVEHKGPLVFAAYAAAFRGLGTSMESARGLAWAAMAVTAALVALIGRRLWPGSRWLGPLAGVLYALISTLSGLSAWWDGAQAEAFMEPLVAAALGGALLLATPGQTPGPAPAAGPRAAAAARAPFGVLLLLGLLVGAASLGKPTALLVLLPLYLALPGGPARRGGGLLAGVGLAWAGAFAAFASRGAGPAFLENALLVNLSYGGQGLAQLPGMGGAFLRRQLMVTPAPLLGAALFGLAWLLCRERPGARRFLGAWLLAAYGALLVQGRMFLYHYTPVVAPLSMLLACGTVGACADLFGGRSGVETPHAPRSRAAWRAAGALALLLLLVGLARLPWSELTLRRAWRAGRVSDAAFHAHLSPAGGANDVDPAETLRAAAWARAHVAPEQTLLVWGFEPAVNFLSRRVCPTRYIYDYFLTSPAIPPRAQERYWVLFRADLAARPADWMAVVSGDANPVEAADSATQLQREPELRRLLAERYEPVERVGDFAFYRLRPAP